jgi:hypothetical protein
MTTCSYLSEVRQSLAAGQWPHAAAPELRAHAESCARCAQEILLTGHFQSARADTIPAAQPADPNLLWWRAQLRRRNAALTQAGRPIAAAQIFALAVVLIAMTELVATNWHSLLAFAAPDAAALPAGNAAFSLTPLTLALAIILITTLSSLILYLSTDRQ